MPKDTTSRKQTGFSLSSLSQALGPVEEEVRLAKAVQSLPLLSESDLVSRLRGDRGLQTANNNAAIRICAAKHFTDCLRLLVANPRVDPMAAGGAAIRELVSEYRTSRSQLVYGLEAGDLKKIRESLALVLSSPNFKLKRLDAVTQNELDRILFDAMDDGEEELALGILKAGIYAPTMILVNKSSRLGYSIQFAVELEKHHGMNFDSVGGMTRRNLLWLLQDPELFKRIAKQSYGPTLQDLELLSAVNAELSDEQKDAVLEWVNMPQKVDDFNYAAAEAAMAAAEAAAGGGGGGGAAYATDGGGDGGAAGAGDGDDDLYR